MALSSLYQTKGFLKSLFLTLAPAGISGWYSGTSEYFQGYSEVPEYNSWDGLRNNENRPWDHLLRVIPKHIHSPIVAIFYPSQCKWQSSKLGTDCKAFKAFGLSGSMCDTVTSQLCPFSVPAPGLIEEEAESDVFVTIDYFSSLNFLWSCTLTGGKL